MHRQRSRKTNRHPDYARSIGAVCQFFLRAAHFHGFHHRMFQGFSRLHYPERQIKIIAKRLEYGIFPVIGQTVSQQEIAPGSQRALQSREIVLRTVSRYLFFLTFCQRFRLPFPIDVESCRTGSIVIAANRFFHVKGESSRFASLRTDKKAGSFALSGHERLFAPRKT